MSLMVCVPRISQFVGEEAHYNSDFMIRSGMMRAPPPANRPSQQASPPSTRCQYLHLPWLSQQRSWLVTISLRNSIASDISTPGLVKSPHPTLPKLYLASEHHRASRSPSCTDINCYLNDPSSPSLSTLCTLCPQHQIRRLQSSANRCLLGPAIHFLLWSFHLPSRKPLMY